MDCLMFPSVTKNFNFNIVDSSFALTLSESQTIPLQSNVNYREMCHKLMESNKVPVFLEKQLTENLKNFIDDQMDQMHDQKVDQLLSESVGSDALDWQSIAQKSHKIDTKYKSLDDLNDKSDDNKFYTMYHQLIHSGVFTESLMKFETSYSGSIRDLIMARDQSYQDLISRQTQEMEDAVKHIGTTLDEQSINALSISHFEESEKLKDSWNDTIQSLKLEQKQEFHDWIARVYEDFKNGNPESIATNLRSLTLDNQSRRLSYDCPDWNHSFAEDQNQMEESFTINLGAQLKTTHNLRLISMDILDLCRMKSDHHSGHYSPQRIQTAMSLYSNSLSALVLLVDNRINSYSGIKQDFAKICSKSTEFHFQDVDNQLDECRKIAEQRRRESGQKRANLQTGDFYVTKHSNLSQIHVVFHLVCDDSLRSSDINSRHPVILGLRNIMKSAHLNDISNITIPLLLIHEMTEDITIQWCLKRAELVLKCIKGFMIEMASLSSSSEENRTVQFVVPKGISSELFSNLTTILPSIFRLSNPLVLRSTYDIE